MPTATGRFLKRPAEQPFVKAFGNRRVLCDQIMPDGLTDQRLVGKRHAGKIGGRSCGAGEQQSTQQYRYEMSM